MMAILAEPLQKSCTFASVSFKTSSKNQSNSMAGGMRTLAKETFFYGMGSVLPKLLSWFLSLYWAFALPKISDIGVLTNF